MKDQGATDLEAELETSLTDMEKVTISNLLADHSCWVPPEVYRAVLVVYPRARRMFRGEAAWFSEVRYTLDTNGLMIYDNQAASRDLW